MVHFCKNCNEDAFFSHIETFLRKHSILGLVPKTELYTCSVCGRVLEIQHKDALKFKRSLKQVHNHV